MAGYSASHTLTPNQTQFCVGDVLIVSGVVQWQVGDAEPDILNDLEDGTLLMEAFNEMVPYQKSRVSHYSVPYYPGEYAVETRAVVDGLTQQPTKVSQIEVFVCE